MVTGGTSQRFLLVPCGYGLKPCTPVPSKIDQEIFPKWCQFGVSKLFRYHLDAVLLTLQPQADWVFKVPTTTVSATTSVTATYTTSTSASSSSTWSSSATQVRSEANPKNEVSLGKRKGFWQVYGCIKHLTSVIVIIL